MVFRALVRARRPIFILVLVGLLAPVSLVPVDAGTPLVFAPTADAFVRKSKPNANFGTDTVLEVDNSPVEHTLLKFEVSGLGSGGAATATLRLHSLDWSPAGGDLHRMDGSWSETGVTWNTAPAADPEVLASIGSVSRNRWYEIDVTSLLTGDGTYSVRITSPSSDGAAYSSREGSASLVPQLLVEPAASSDSTPPTQPAGLTATPRASGRVELAWTAATDDRGVAGYAIFRDGVQIGTSELTDYSDATVRPQTTYGYTVVAYDAAGNRSPPSAQASATTPSPEPSVVFAAAGDHGATARTADSLRTLDETEAHFYLALGDLDYDQTATDEAWCDYVKSRLPTAGPTFPFQLVAGNHEEQGGPDGYIVNHARCLPDRLASTMSPTGRYGAEYLFDYPSYNPLVRVIMISPGLTIENVSYTYTKGSPHYEWLRATIDDARADGVPWVVVGMHKACLVAGGKTCEIGADLMNLLVEKQVDLVLQAHAHNYQRGKQLALDPSTCPEIVPGTFDQDCVADDGADNLYPKGTGTVVVIDGTFGVSLYPLDPADPDAPYIARMNDTTYGFTRYTLTSDRLDARFVASSGTFTDSFTIGAGSPDTSPPTAPTGLTATASGATRVDLSWDPSTDDRGVAGYAVLRDGVQIATSTSTQYADTLVNPGTTYTYTVVAYDAQGNRSLPSAPASVTTPRACSSGQFEATYFNNTTLSGTPVLARCEAGIDYNWGSGSPDPAVTVDYFSTRWAGTHSFAGGDYTFTARSDDGIRVWVDGTLIIDAWKRQAPTTYTATPTLTAGDHQVKVEYFEYAGGAVAEVSWAAA